MQAQLIQEKPTERKWDRKTKPQLIHEKPMLETQNTHIQI